MLHLNFSHKWYHFLTNKFRERQKGYFVTFWTLIWLETKATKFLSRNMICEPMNQFAGGFLHGCSGKTPTIRKPKKFIYQKCLSRRNPQKGSPINWFTDMRTTILKKGKVYIVLFQCLEPKGSSRNFLRPLKPWTCTAASTSAISAESEIPFWP